MVNNGGNKKPKFLFVDFSRKPLPKVIADDREVTDPKEIHELLKNKQDYKDYLASRKIKESGDEIKRNEQ